MGAAAATVAQAEPDAAQVKAAYLVNFTRYVSWPDGSPHQLCIVGADEVADRLERSRGKTGLAVRRLLEPAELAGCTLLYLGPDSTQPGQWLGNRRDTAMLTVGEVPGFLDRGGMIALIPQGNTLRFAVNLDPLRRARLQVSSRLLALAQQVAGQTP